MRPGTSRLFSGEVLQAVLFVDGFRPAILPRPQSTGADIDACRWLHRIWTPTPRPLLGHCT